MKNKYFSKAIALLLCVSMLWGQVMVSSALAVDHYRSRCRQYRDRDNHAAGDHSCAYSNSCTY